MRKEQDRRRKRERKGWIDGKREASRRWANGRTGEEEAEKKKRDSSKDERWKEVRVKKESAGEKSEKEAIERSY